MSDNKYYVINHSEVIPLPSPVQMCKTLQLTLVDLPDKFPRTRHFELGRRFFALLSSGWLRSTFAT